MPMLPFHQEADGIEPKKVAPIKSSEVLSIGYGNSGVIPCEFELDSSTAEDCTYSYLKIIFTRCATDFSMFFCDEDKNNELPASGTRSTTVRGPSMRMRYRMGAVDTRRFMQKEEKEAKMSDYLSVILKVQQKKTSSSDT